jgi:hypothetical protein
VLVDDFTIANALPAWPHASPIDLH